jgi:Domain of unknown function (DUF397)
MSTLEWRKSSRSGDTGGQCVEIAAMSVWRMSARSTDTGGNSVELAAVSA